MLTLTLVLAAISGISAAAGTKNVLWLPLGDSITFGWSVTLTLRARAHTLPTTLGG